MRRKQFIVGITAFMAMALVACASAPPVRQPVAVNGSVVFKNIPKGEGIVVKDDYLKEGNFNGLAFMSSYGHVDLSKRRNDVMFSYKNLGVPSQFSVANELVGTASGKRSVLAYSKYIGTVSMEDGAKSATVTVTPKEIETRANPLIIGLSVPDYPIEAAFRDIIERAFVELKVEVNSEFDKDAVFNNFRRSLESRETTDGSDGVKRGVFILKKQGVYIYPVIVEVWPYQKGCKTVATVKIYFRQTASEGDNRVVDVKPQVDEVRQKIESIIKG